MRKNPSQDLIPSSSLMVDDPDIANWVLKFLLRQPIEYRTLNSLLLILPLSNNDLNLKKLILLKKLEYEASRNSISENALELLEQLEELKFQNGSEKIPEVMKRAYGAVAVCCTINALVKEDEKGRWKYFEVVKRVWRKRIGRMKKLVQKGGLCSAVLLAWEQEFEAAIWDDNFGENVVRKGYKVNAVKAVQSYVREERERMGPSFLELVASNEFTQRVPGMGGVDQVTLNHTEENVDDPGLSNCARYADNGSTAELTPRYSRGVRMIDSDRMRPMPSFRNYNLPTSAETNKVVEGLESSLLELKAAVTDPLPEAINYTKSIAAGMAIGNPSHYPIVENSMGDAGFSQAGNVPKPSLMGRNVSAFTYEWEDSPEENETRLRLRTPVMINVSPLMRYNDEGLKRRRQPRKWSVLEEDTLKAGVQRYGIGNWKFIRMTYLTVFEDRTEVDLKDKWRNLTRKRAHTRISNVQVCSR